MESDARGARVAVAAAFFVNGAALSSWAPRIPQIQDALDLPPLALGLALAGTNAGALLGTVLAGRYATRHGSRPVVVASGLVLTLALVLPAVAPSGWALGLALGVVGVGDGAMDAAMNTHGVMVERRYGRSIMHSFHAAWSSGAGIGAVLASVAAGARLDPAIHLGLVGIVLAATLAVSSRRLLPGGVDQTSSGTGRLRVRAIPWLAAAALAAAYVEGSAFDWGALFTREVAGAGPGVAGAAVAAFAVAMIVGRTVGDRLAQRFGTGTVAVGGAATAALGFGLAAAVSVPAGALTGYAVAGLGAAPVFPALFTASSRVPGLAPAVGIASMSLVARVGFMSSGPLAGALAEATTLRAVVVSGLVAAVLAASVLPRAIGRT